jgi:hypothetical protein
MVTDFVDFVEVEGWFWEPGVSLAEIDICFEKTVFGCWRKPFEEFLRKRSFFDLFLFCYVGCHLKTVSIE